MASRDRMFHVLVALGVGTIPTAACSGEDTGSASAPDGPGDAPEAGHPNAPVLGDGGVAPVLAGSADAGRRKLDAAALPLCEHPQQVACQQRGPDLVDCVCNPAAPLSQEDCGVNRRFECMSYDPPTGCDCVYITGPR